MTEAKQPAIQSKEVKHSKIPLFFGLGDGTDEVSAVDLVNRIKALCEMLGKNTDEVKCNEIYLALKRDTVTWYKPLRAMQISNTEWELMKRWFCKDYDFRIPEQVAYKLDALRQKSIKKVADKTRYYFQQGIFIGGLKDEIKRKMLDNNNHIKSLSKARDLTQKLEFIQMSKGKMVNPTAASVFALEGYRQALGEDANLTAEDEEDSQVLEEAAINLMNWYKKHLKRNFPNRRITRSLTDTLFMGKCFKGGLLRNQSNCRKQRQKGDDARSEDNTEENRRARLSPLKNW